MLAAPGLARGATVEVVVDQSDHKIVFAGGSGEVNTVSLGVVGELGDQHQRPGYLFGHRRNRPDRRGHRLRRRRTGGFDRDLSAASLSPSHLPPGRPALAGGVRRVRDQSRRRRRFARLDRAPRKRRGRWQLQGASRRGAGGDGLVDGPNHASFTPGPGADSVTAGAGSDWAYASEGAADEADLYDLGPDRDTIDYSVAAYPVSVSLAGTADSGAAGEGDRILGAERVRGGSAADLLTGADAQPVSEFYGFGGDDTIVGGAQLDIVEGGSGDDVIKGRDGNDELFGDGAFGPDGDDRNVGATVSTTSSARTAATGSAAARVPTR